MIYRPRNAAAIIDCSASAPDANVLAHVEYLLNGAAENPLEVRALALSAV